VNDKLFSTIMWQVSEYKLFNLQPKIDWSICTGLAEDWFINSCQ
jgi:hypothetical protein